MSLCDFGFEKWPVRLDQQAEAAPARHRPGARSARRIRCLLTDSQTK
jgi:hypothetical protein